MFVSKQAAIAESIDDPKHQETLKSQVATYKAKQSQEIKVAKEQYKNAVLYARQNKTTPPTSWRSYMTTNVLSDAELMSQARAALQRELARAAGIRRSHQTLFDALIAAREAAFGNAAIAQSLEDGDDGFLVRSPKSFLGAKINTGQIVTFSIVCERIIEHIKSLHDAQLGVEVKDVVIGRPVNFHGTGGEDGNRQALRILEDAAKKSGYKNVEFMLEPVAAAIDFERTLTEDNLVLVIDVGGGTTDCTLLHLGPSYRSLEDRMAGVLAHTGARTGGLDLDIQLTWGALMPAFGKGAAQRGTSTPVPNHIFWGAAAINDIVEQNKFFKMDLSHYLRRSKSPELFERLVTLQAKRSTPQLHLAAEAAKISLSDTEETLCQLGFIEPELAVHVSRKIYEESIWRPLSKFIALAKEAVKQGGAKPDLVYVTGGTAKSPIIREAIYEALGNEANIVSGNLFEGVVSGLSLWAERIYQH